MYTVIETPTFSHLAADYWTEEERGAFTSYIAANPEAGAVVPGSGGVRKVRWGYAGRGKRGGVRVVVYFNRLAHGEIWLLLIYGKSARENIPSHCASSDLKRKSKMPKIERELNTRDAKRDIGAELLVSVREMKAGVRGRTHQPVVSEVARARLASGLSQPAFAALLGVSVRTLQDWEQGRRTPSGAAKTLLKIAERHPEVLQELRRSASKHNGCFIT